MNYQASVSLRKFMFLPVLLAGLFLLFPLQARAQLGCDDVTVSMCYGAACQSYADDWPEVLPSHSPIHFNLVNAVAGQTYSILVEYEKIGSNVSQKIITKTALGQVGQRVTVRDFLIADQYEYRDLFYYQEADAGETPGYKNLSLVAPDGKVCPFRTIKTFTVDTNPQAAIKCGTTDLTNNVCRYNSGGFATFIPKGGSVPPVICNDESTKCCQSETASCKAAQIDVLICGYDIDPNKISICTCAESTSTCCGYVIDGTCSPEPQSCKNTKDFNGLCGAKGGCPPGSECNYISGFGGECVEKLACGGSLRCGMPGTDAACGRDAGCLDGEQCTVSAADGAKCILSEVNCGYIAGAKCGDTGTHYVCGEVGGCPNGLYCDQSRSVCISSTYCNPRLPIGVDPPPGGGTGGDTPGPETKPTLDIFDGPTSADFKLLNPLAIFGSPYADDFSSPAGIINRALLFAFPLAGLILFVMIVWGGFEILSGATNSKGVTAGRQRITAALMGFGLLFVSFWIIQIVEYIFNLAIL